MNQRVLLDNNVFDALLAADPAHFALLLRKVVGGSIECYVSPEVIEETFGLLHAPRHRSKLQPRAALLLQLRVRILAPSESIMVSEVQGPVHIGHPHEAALLDILKRTAAGEVSAAMLELGLQAGTSKKAYDEYFTKQQADLLPIVMALPPEERAKLTFETCHARHWELRGAESIRHHCAQAGIVDPERILAEAARVPERVVRIRLFSKLFAFILFEYHIRGGDVSGSDLPDIRQLFYMHDLDTLVTNDRALHRHFGTIFRSTKEVLTVQGFLRLILRS